MNNSMYPIDRIIVMSLERTPKRWRRWEGAAAIMEIDFDIVSIAFGKDNLDFNNNSKEIARAAADDGFPFVAEYAMDKVDERNKVQQTAATAAQIWNYCRILRRIADTNETALIIFDDKMLTIDFHEFCQVVDEVRNVRGEEFYALQLKLRGGLNDIKLQEIDVTQRLMISRQIFDGVFSRTQGNYKDVFLRKGISGFDETIVFSPAGAEWMLKCLDLAPGFYNYLDHFICKALPTFAESAIKRNKGIYCPSEIAYKFIDEYMLMGTTTDWATKESPGYNQSIKEVDTNYYWGKPKSVKKETKVQSLQSELKSVMEKK